MKSALLFLSLATLGNAVLTAAEPQAVVEVSSEFVIGAHAKGKWLKSEPAAKAVKPGTTFRVYGLTREYEPVKGNTKATGNTDVCEDVFSIALTPKPEHGAVALAAPWNALPRIPKIASTTQPIYVQAVREF